MFSGGALSRFSVFALGIMPYISASIIFQMLTTCCRRWSRCARRRGRSAEDHAVHALCTLGLALVQSYGIAVALQSQQGLVLNPGFMFVFICMVFARHRHDIPDVAGRADHRAGLGNGISILIFSGIVAGLRRRSAGCSSWCAPAPSGRWRRSSSSP